MSKDDNEFLLKPNGKINVIIFFRATTPKPTTTTPKPTTTTPKPTTAAPKPQLKIDVKDSAKKKEGYDYPKPKTEFKLPAPK